MKALVRQLRTPWKWPQWCAWGVLWTAIDVSVLVVAGLRPPWWVWFVIGAAQVVVIDTVTLLCRVLRELGCRYHDLGELMRRLSDTWLVIRTDSGRVVARVPIEAGSVNEIVFPDSVADDMHIASIEYGKGRE